MSRPLRIQYPGAVYHITARGNRRSNIFFDNYDRELFLHKLAIAISHHGWICHAYCLMKNHYHLVIETPEANLSKGMRDLNKDYSQAFNRKHETVGHVFQGRYKSFCIEKEQYLLEVIRYTALNPVRAKIVRNPADWVWSSFAATAGLAPRPTFLSIDWVLGQFASSRALARKKFIAFVMAGVEAKSPFDGAAHRSIVGSPQFIFDMSELAEDSSRLDEIAKEERIIGRPSLSDIFSTDQTKKQRNDAIVFGRICCGYSVAEMARYLKLSKSTVSKVSKEMDGSGRWRLDPKL